MWLPLLGLLLGLIVGIAAPVTIPVGYASYLAIAILSSLDSVVGGLRAAMDEQYDNTIFISGFFINIILAPFRHGQVCYQIDHGVYTVHQGRRCPGQDENLLDSVGCPYPNEDQQVVVTQTTESPAPARREKGHQVCKY